MNPNCNSDAQTESARADSVQRMVSLEPSSITEYLDRIQRDNDAVIKRLLGAPLSLTGEEEPKLYDIMHKIRTLIADAKTVWR